MGTKKKLISPRTNQQKAHYVRLARQIGRAEAARRARVSKATISHWTRELRGAIAAGLYPEHKPSERSRDTGPTGIQRGRAVTRAVYRTSELEALRVALTAALERVQRMIASSTRRRRGSR